MKTKRTTSYLPLYIGIAILIFAIGYGILLQMESVNEKKFVTALYEQENNRIWELRYNNPQKIYINIIDPQSNKQIHQIKDKKDADLDPNINFQLFKHDDGIVLIGYGETPVFDVYHKDSYEKISDIHDFQQIDPVSDIEIGRFGKSGYHYHYFSNIIIEIFSTSFEKYYYDIQDKILFHTEEQLLTFINDRDTETISLPLTVFTLFRVSEADVMQLYKITSKDKSNFNYLSGIDNSGSSTLEGFNQYKKRDCDKCIITRLTEHMFRNTKIDYHDTSLVVLVTTDPDPNYNKQSITAFNTKGVQLFEINQNDFPNLERRKKSQRIIPTLSGYHHLYDQSHLIIFFGEYGAINIDFAYGGITWKYEPEVNYKTRSSGRRR